MEQYIKFFIYFVIFFIFLFFIGFIFKWIYNNTKWDHFRIFAKELNDKYLTLDPESYYPFKLASVDTNLSSVDTNLSSVDTNLSSVDTNLSSVDTNLSSVDIDEVEEIESDDETEDEEDYIVNETFSDRELEVFYRCKYPFIGNFQSIGEKECRRVLKKYFGLPFKSCRPHFLINPLTGATLELDCYEGSLQLAVEYQGRQHYYYSPQFHKTIEDFHKQQDRDKLKAALCSRLGIYLIRVPYTIRKEDIEEFILSSLPPKYRNYRKKGKG